ncbi:MAG: pilus assembly protein [Rhodospirillales bacterium]|jgi:Flp pilus assembly pilin Flp|nr:pilus assembly protein [Rhodospirillales bacterium]
MNARRRFVAADGPGIPGGAARAGVRRRGLDRRGAASIEAALALALVVLPMLLGLFDLGTALTLRLRVDRALQAGMFAAWALSGPSAAQIVPAAVAGGGSFGPAISAQVGFSCDCLPATGTLAQATPVACTDACPSDQVAGEWMSLTTRGSASLPFPLPGLVSPLVLSATATVRMQ